MFSASNLNRKLGAGSWLIAGFCGALVLAIITVVVKGTSAHATVIALQVTGRWSFILFWPAYAGSAFGLIFEGSPRFLTERGREFGLAYAAAHLVHVVLVVWLYHVSNKPPVPQSTLWFFSVGIAWTYLLALFSIRRLRNMLNSKLWQILRLTALNYIAAAFLIDFVVGPLIGNIQYQGIRRILGYLPFGVLAIAGPILRITAAALRLRRNLSETRAIGTAQ